jgi:signal transduction histidine kinase
LNAIPKILLVDDNPDFLEVTERILSSRAGYNVLTLTEGSRTLEMAKNEKPDIIVLDVPVLFLTAVGGDPSFRARCLEEGADDFIMKPANSEELVARLSVLLRIKNLQDELRRERDELEQKVQERARELKEKETLAAIGKMVAGIAHEIRNPLGAISNSAAVLSRDLILEGEDSKLMDIIVRESERLRVTINDFLKFAHPGPYHFIPVDLKKLIEDVILLAQRDNLCTDGVSIRSDLRSDLPTADVDQDRIHQVLWNLIRNSLEAVRGHGTITLTAQRAVHDDEDTIYIKIKDDGPGIPQEDIKNIFEPFFTRKARGSGLGLAMVQSTVKAHGGAINVVSRNGEGTVFKIWIPVKQGSTSE